MSIVFEFPCISFRRIPLFEQDIEKDFEFNKEPCLRRYIAVVDISKLPLEIPRETNPRDVKLTTRVAKQIEESLKTEEYFHILNRGIVISARSVQHNNKTSLLTISFGSDSNLDLYGIVDGGHTYEIIKNYITGNDFNSESKRYVSLEIYTGIGDENLNNSINIADFASARNNSVPVDSKSLAELDKKFDPIKDAVKNQVYADKIAYRQNSDKDIDIREIIALMTVFDAEKYVPTDIENQPVIAYSQKEACLNDYLSQFDEEQNGQVSRYKKLCSILPEILELSDHIRHKVPIIWNGDLGGKIGTKINKIKPPKDNKEVKKNIEQYYYLPVLNEAVEIWDTKSKIWLWLPLLASMRVLVDYSNGNAFFRTDPKDFFDNNARVLIGILYQNCKSNFVPNRIGKDKGMWTSLVQAVWMQAVQSKIIDI